LLPKLMGAAAVTFLPRPISDFTCRRIKDALNLDRQQLFHTIGPRQWMDS